MYGQHAAKPEDFRLCFGIRSWIGAEILLRINREFVKKVESLLRYLSAALFFCPRLLAESLPFTLFLCGGALVIEGRLRCPRARFG
jgi:hypothetical protein